MFEENTNSPLQERIDAIKERFAVRIEDLKARGNKIGSDYEKPSTIGAIINVDFKVDWKDVDIIFDMPTVTVRDQNISLDLPEVTSSTQNISFDVPDMRMVDRVVGTYPEVHFPDIIWKPIIISVPEPYMRRVDISLDLPEVAMRRKDFVLGIPQITMEQVHWILKLPQFTVVNVSAQTTEIENKGKALKTEGEQLAEQMKSEISAEVANYTAGIVGAAFSTKNQIGQTFDNALGTVKTAIDQLVAQKCDPIKVPTAGGDVNLRKIYDDLQTEKNSTISQIDENIVPVQ